MPILLEDVAQQLRELRRLVGVGTSTDPTVPVDPGDPGPVGNVVRTDVANAMTEGVATVYLDKYGALPAITLRTASGSVSSPGAVVQDQTLGAYSFDGWGLTTFGGLGPGMTASASEAWSDTARGAWVSIFTVPPGTASCRESVRFTEYGDLAPTVYGLTNETGTLVEPGHSAAVGMQHQGGVVKDAFALSINQRFTQTQGSGRTTSVDCTWFLGDLTITSATANFTQRDVGKYIQGPHAYIKSVTNSTTCVLEYPGAKRGSFVGFFSGPNAITICDPLPGSPLNMQINHVIDNTSGWADGIATQSGFGLNSNQGPRAYINLEGTTVFTDGGGGGQGGWAGTPLIFQTSNQYVNKPGEALTNVGLGGALFNVSSQVVSDSATITAKTGPSTGRMFVDNFTFALRGAGAGITAPELLYSSFTTQFGLMGTAIYFGEYRQFWAALPNTSLQPKLPLMTGFYADTLAQASTNYQYQMFPSDATIGDTTTSSSTVTIGASSGTRTFTVSTGLNLYGGQVVSATANTGFNIVIGTVDTYSTGSGILVINVTTAVGSGTYSSWNITGYNVLHGMVAGDGATLTLNYVGSTAPEMHLYKPTIMWKRTGSTNASNVFASAATYQNYFSSTGISLGTVSTFSSANTYQAKSQTDVVTQPITEFWSIPTYQGVTGGILTALSHSGFRSTMIMNSGGNLGTRWGFRYEDIVGTANPIAVAYQFGMYVPWLQGAAKNVGIFNGSTTAYPAPNTRTPTAHYKIIPDASYVVLTGTTAISLGNTTGAVPCIAPGVEDGQRLRLYYVGSGTLTFTESLGVTLGSSSAVMNSGDIFDFMWTTLTSKWLLSKGASSTNLLIAPSAAASGWGALGFLSASGTYAMPGASTTLHGPTLIDAGPYMKWSSASTLSFLTVVKNAATISNDGVATTVMKPTYTVYDTQTIRVDARSDTLGSSHYTAYQDVTVDAINSGTFITNPNVYGAYSHVTAQSSLGTRYGWKFDNTTLSGAVTTNVLTYFLADSIKTSTAAGNGAVHATVPILTAQDVNMPIIGSEGVIPTTSVTSGQNLKSAAFIAGTGVLTLSVTVASLTTSTYTFPTSGKVAVFVGCSTNTLAVGAATANICYITYTGVSGSTLTGCKNVSAASAGTLTTSTGDKVAYMLVIPFGGNNGFLPAGALINRQVTATSMNYTDNGDPVNGPFTLTVNSPTPSTLSSIDVGSTIIDADGQIPPGAQITAYHSTESVDINVPFASSGTYNITTTGDLTLMVALPIGVISIMLVVDAPLATPAGTAVNQVGFYSQALSGATTTNVGYWWDDTSGDVPATNDFYGIWSPTFQVNGTTGMMTTEGGVTTTGGGVTADTIYGSNGSFGVGIYMRPQSGVESASQVTLNLARYTPITAGMITGTLASQGYDAGSVARTSAKIDFVNDSNAAWSGSSLFPSRMDFFTTSAGTITRQLSLDHSGTLHHAPTITTNAISASTFAVKSDGSVWVAPSAYTSGQPSAAAATISATGAITALSAAIGTATLGATSSYTASLTEVADTATNSFATTASMQHFWQNYTATDSWAVAPSAFGMFFGVRNVGTFKNDVAATVNLSPIVSFQAAFTKTVDTATGRSLSADIDFSSGPTYTVVSTGAFTSATHSSFAASANMNGGSSSTMTTHNGLLSNFTATTGTTTTVNHILINDATTPSTGTIGTQYGIDIASMNAATVNVGIRNASKTSFSPSTVQALVAATTISPNATALQVTSTASITLTATPTITAGVHGQMLVILNNNTTAARNITFQSEATAAGTNLSLAAGTIVVGPRGSLTLMYSSTLTRWVQIGQNIGNN